MKKLCKTKNKLFRPTGHIGPTLDQKMAGKPMIFIITVQQSVTNEFVHLKLQAWVVILDSAQTCGPHRLTLVQDQLVSTHQGAGLRGRLIGPQH